MSIAEQNRVLVVAAHPDDEVLGCGGTIARHADAGDQVQVLIVAEGATSRQAQRDRAQVGDKLSVLAKAAQMAGSILGAEGVELLDFPDNRLDSLDRLDLIKQIEDRIDRYQPQVVYLHHVGDVNIDHRRLHEAVVTAAAPRLDIVLGFSVLRCPAVLSGSLLVQLRLFLPTGSSTYRNSGNASVML